MPNALATGMWLETASRSPANGWHPGWLGLVAATAFFWPLHPALSHPLGDQSVDHYSQVKVTPDKVIVVYHLDQAEVPTFQEMKRLDSNGAGLVDEAEMQKYATKQALVLASGLHLGINGTPLPLIPTSAQAFLLPGEGALPTLRLVATLETAPGAVALARRANAGAQAGTYRDVNDPHRIGWRQIGMQGLGTKINDESVNGHPANLSPSPQGFAMDQAGDQSNVREVDFHFLPVTAGAGPGGLASPAGVGPRRRDADPFASLLTAEHLTAGKMGWLLFLAAGLGGLHALAPGHGKTLVSAYLVGSRGTAWNAVLLGLIVTFTHTIGVFALGLVTLFASRYLLPETLYPWLTASSGLVIALIGLLRLLGRDGGHQHGHEEQYHHEYEHEHEHTGGSADPHARGVHHEDHAHTRLHAHVHDAHDREPGTAIPAPAHASLLTNEHQRSVHDHGGHDHHHLPPAGEAITGRSLLALGVSGGLVPCPSALVVLLSAVALRQIGFGLALIVAFSAGLAAVLTAIGLAMVSARNYLSSRFSPPPWILGAVPRVGGALIFGIGLAIATPAVIVLARRL